MQLSPTRVLDAAGSFQDKKKVWMNHLFNGYTRYIIPYPMISYVLMTELHQLQLNVD